MPQTSTLANERDPVPDFPSLTQHKLCDLIISAPEVYKLIKKLDSTKDPGPDEIPAVVLKDLSPELFPVLTKLFNRYLKEILLPLLSAVYPVFRNAEGRSSHYHTISLLSVISKCFEPL